MYLSTNFIQHKKVAKTLQKYFITRSQYRINFAKYRCNNHFCNQTVIFIILYMIEKNINKLTKELSL